MSQMKKIALGLAGLIAVAWWLWPAGTTHEDLEVNDMSPLVNRVWIDHIPTTERDKIEVLALIEDPRFGGFSTTSAYEGDWSAFEWVHDNGLRFHMLQSQKVHKVKVSVIKGDPCKPFDYCMRIKGAPRGAKRYVSMEDWVIESGTDINPRALVNKLLADGADGADRADEDDEDDKR